MIVEAINDVCARAPSGIDQYTDLLLGWVKYGVAAVIIAAGFVSVGAMVVGRLGSLSQATQMGASGVGVGEPGFEGSNDALPRLRLARLGGSRPKLRQSGLGRAESVTVAALSGALPKPKGGPWPPHTRIMTATHSSKDDRALLGTQR
jgi:hypothetical protein